MLPHVPRTYFVDVVQAPNKPRLADNRMYDIKRLLDKGYFANIPQNDPQWLEIRKQFTMTGSEFAQALGISKYGSRNMLYAKKFDPSAIKQNAFRDMLMENGKLGEVQCMQILKTELPKFLYAQEEEPWMLLPDEPVPCRNEYTVKETGLWIIQEHYDWENSEFNYGATPDGLVCWGKGEEIIATIEIKTPSKTRDVYKGLLFQKIELELDHYVQVQSQLLAVGVNTAYYACYTPDKTVVIRVRANVDFQKWLIHQLEQFSKKHLNPDNPVRPPNLRKGVGKAMKEHVRAFMLNTHIEHMFTLNTEIVNHVSTCD